MNEYAHREVNLTKRINTPNGLRYCPVAMSANGRVKPDVVIIDGNEETHREGAYYIEWRDGGKRIRLSVDLQRKPKRRVGDHKPNALRKRT